MKKLNFDKGPSFQSVTKLKIIFSTSILIELCPVFKNIIFQEQLSLAVTVEVIY